MKFHLPSFKWYFERQFDYTFDIWFHGWTAYVETRNPFFTQKILTEIVITAITEALDAPLDAPDGPRRRSVLDAPIDTHIDAVQGALSERYEYLQKQTISTEHGERYEWQIDLRSVQRILIETRQTQDVEISKKIIAEHGKFFVSDRLLEKQILHRIGVCFSNRRVREITKALVDEGVLKNNGHLRTHGREVV